VLPEVSGPTPFATKRIRKDSILSAFQVLVDEGMIWHIQRCTETEAFACLGDDSWSVSLEELEAFMFFCMLVVYIRITDPASLICKACGPQFFVVTMPRDKFREN